MYIFMSDPQNQDRFYLSSMHSKVSFAIPDFGRTPEILPPPKPHQTSFQITRIQQKPEKMAANEEYALLCLENPLLGT